LVPKVRKFFIL